MSRVVADAPRPARFAPGLLARADWLTGERARAWGWILAVSLWGIAAGWVLLSQDGIDPAGRPLGTDYISFWTAGRLALDGHPEQAYQPAIHGAAELARFPTDREGYTAFFYPPAFLLICLPFALLPYLAALCAWLIAAAIPLIVCLRALLPKGARMLPPLAFPAILVNAGHGQNAFLSAACFGGGMLLLDRAPVWAGICLGALAFKPHLAIAVPIALVAARRWRSLFATAASAGILLAVSWLAFGTATWEGFGAISPLARATLVDGLVDPAKMQSAFAAMRVIGAGVGVAWAAQGAAAAFAVVMLIAVARRRPGARAEGAAMVAACLICTPFILDYDLVCLALPLAWLFAEAIRDGWRTYEKALAGLCFLLPLFSRTLATALHLPLGPLALSALLFVVARRAMTCPAGQRPLALS